MSGKLTMLSILYMRISLSHSLSFTLWSNWSPANELRND